MSLASFNTSWKHQKTRGFWMFSGRYGKRSVMWNELMYKLMVFYWGHKGQNSAETFGLGILMLWFLSLGIPMLWLFVLWKDASESRCCGLVVSVSRCRCVLVPESRCRGFFVFGTSILWFFGLEIPMSWYMSLYVLKSQCSGINPNVVFVFTKSIMQHNS